MYRIGRPGVVKCVRQLFRRPQSTVTAEPFLNGSSSSYVEAMYESWQQNPSSVHKVMRFLFFILMVVFIWSLKNGECLAGLTRRRCLGFVVPCTFLLNTALCTVFPAQYN